MAEKVEAKLDGAKRTLILRAGTGKKAPSSPIVIGIGGQVEQLKVDEGRTSTAINMDVVRFVQWNAEEYYGYLE